MQTWSADDLQLWRDPLPGQTPDLSSQRSVVLRHHYSAQYVAALRASQDGHQACRLVVNFSPPPFGSSSVF